MLNYRQESIAASGVFSTPAGGDFFLLRRSTLPVRVSFDGGQGNDLEPGLMYRPPRPFSSVTIQNLDADKACQVGFYVGTGEATFLVPNSRLPDTYFSSVVNNVIYPAGTLTFQPLQSKRAGQAAPDRRKCIEIANLHATESLDLRVSLLNGAVVTAGTIFPSTSKVIETTESVAISNNTAAIIPFRSFETYYFTP